MIRDVTIASTSVTIPDVTIPKVTEIGNKASKSLSAQAATGGV